MDAVAAAHEAGYRFALVRPNSKVGIGSWNREEISLPLVLDHLQHGGNVAIKLAETRQRTRLCVIDIDNKKHVIKKDDIASRKISSESPLGLPVSRNLRSNATRSCSGIPWPP